MAAVHPSAGASRDRGLQHNGDRGIISALSPKQLCFCTIFQIYGSVIPRCLIWAIFGATAGGLMEGLQWSYVQQHSVWLHPYALHVFGMVLGFSLVMRIQIAYQRFWEGATACHLASSKWADACMQVMAFDEASKDAFSDAGFEFRMLVLHYASLMHACALVDMRQDDQFGMGLFTLRPEDPFMFRANRSMNNSLGRRESAENWTERGQGAAAEDGGGPRPSVNYSMLSSAGRAAAPDLSGRSERAYTVPLQMLLRTRSVMGDTLKQTINSFEAIDAMERAIRPRVSTGETAGKPAPKPALTRQSTQLKQGAMSSTEYMAATVFRTSGKSQLALSNAFEVLGGVSDIEVQMLSRLKPSDRAFKVQTWLVRLMTERLLGGGLGIPPPLLSRTYQVLSDGTAAAVQARKISHVEFPFALRQLLAVLLTVFSILAPMCIAAFMESPPLVSIISFFVLLGYVALNETARELEQPFGLDANDLELTLFQKDFNSKLAQLFDLSAPDLGYAVSTRLADSFSEASVP